jgi:hypothetical protein
MGIGVKDRHGYYWILPRQPNQLFDSTRNNQVGRDMKVLFVALLTCLLPGCIVHRPALEGHVYDSVAGAPVPEITIRRVLSYKFLFSVGGDPQTEYLYDEQTRTDSTGRYAFPSIVRVLPPGGHGIQDSIEISDIQEYFGGFAHSLTMGTWSSRIALIPKVMKLEECRDSEPCLRQNSLRARQCYLNPDYSEDCSRRSPEEWSLFFDDEEDFLKCKGRTDLETMNCIAEQVSYTTLGIPSERSCSVLESELARNYCYLLLAGRQHYRKIGDCERITDKEVPTSWIGNVAELGQVGAFLGTMEHEKGLRDFRSICLSLR